MLHLLPHFLPIGLFLMLHLLGIVTAIAGLAPAFLAIGDNIAAHRHFGEVFNNEPTLPQHIGGTLFLPFLAAPRHGAKLVAGALPQLIPVAAFACGRIGVLEIVARK
ncbi:hypothetical protein FXO38_04333 [Capsicum annuum]|nr:hypothetical protein FXO38_04333 [Capsicum annuum]KAF3678814.1 hypothetical protein FXO37_04195 [Capsicum annuum]